MANFNTNLVFANNDNTSAKDLAQILGAAKTSETRENRSYSPHSFRDGKQLNENISTNTVVTPTEIMMLDTFEYYLKLQGSYPITRHKAKLKKYTKGADACLESRAVHIGARSYEDVILGDKAELALEGEGKSSTALSKGQLLEIFKEKEKKDDK